jgi:hypothetical protein
MPAGDPSTFAISVLVAGFRAGFAQLPNPYPYPGSQSQSGIQFEQIGDPAYAYMPPELQRGQMQGRPPLDPNMPPDIQGLPLSAFQGLFPGPLVYDQGLTAADIFGTGIPDPIIMEMLAETHAGFQDDVVPMMQAASASEQAEMDSPHVCHQDVLIHCGKSHSQLHCLGKHKEDISKDCRDIVSKSVPFLCSSSIDTYCDTLNAGILPCLEAHLDNIVEQDCLDSMKFTRSVITTANTHKAKAKNAKSGATASVMPSPQDVAEAVQKELRRIARHPAKFLSKAMRYLWMTMTVSALVYVLCASPRIFIPELVASWRLVRRFDGLRAKTCSVLSGSRGSMGEATCLLEPKDSLNPAIDWQL